ncbi:hypothetical protein [Corallococcus aberystwythensis]|uniref:Uncharacterized protein n=1 Tax=Corallococcus aberystwythensis TaxID=2316722 RepID=A0A3A8PTL3_9BACT|nr:hypothetical protein [Corallococcus aberystwythensis]RKH58380.1 hypothetical protein D7W81_29235 [Corallococcus aberystwythensis]
MRKEIDKQAQANPGLYSGLVKNTNGVLQACNVGISPASQRSVMDSLQMVGDGRIPQSAAHLREVDTFIQDAKSSFSRGNIKQGLVESLGVGMNMVAGAKLAAFEATVTPPAAKALTDTASKAAHEVFDAGGTLAKKVFKDEGAEAMARVRASLVAFCR